VKKDMENGSEVTMKDVGEEAILALF
jgi:hypothetical protein